MRFISENEFCSGKRVLIFGCGPVAIVFLNSYKISPDSVIGFIESEKSMEKILGGGGVESFRR